MFARLRPSVPLCRDCLTCASIQDSSAGLSSRQLTPRGPAVKEAVLTATLQPLEYRAMQSRTRQPNGLLRLHTEAAWGHVCCADQPTCPAAVEGNGNVLSQGQRCHRLDHFALLVPQLHSISRQATQPACGSATRKGQTDSRAP